VKVLTGTSGFAFKEWKGSFYPDDLKDDAMLGFYASRYPTVEINNTFYRLPKESVLRDWAEQVPEQFTFAIKASQRITHFARIKPEAADALGFLLKNTAVMGGRLGAILFQLPPNLKKDLDRLKAFLALLPEGRRFTMEFRHESWFDEDVFAALRERDVAMCAIEQEDFQSPLQPTARWGYLRLHRFDYDPTSLGVWAQRVAAQGWSEAYVYFKHDEGIGSGPPAVDAFLKALGSAAVPSLPQDVSAASAAR
jgi:uncharacterized protein YecE (DUF72 family)